MAIIGKRINKLGFVMHDGLIRPRRRTAKSRGRRRAPLAGRLRLVGQRRIDAA
ncbi:hypothetical protein H7H78_08350 [Mycobacterium shinjukuense]|uniref:hypothetical protein n=1 Tax=Mycobacterium shinjukuense TaxID=398694 RepID=UPI001301B8E7|nr:hypothetical protein [Mycobacterium shinjukuense]MCV6985441.1 hypothetical protein [Mycobacterium shinjukuense]